MSVLLKGVNLFQRMINYSEIIYPGGIIYSVTPGENVPGGPFFVAMIVPPGTTLRVAKTVPPLPNVDRIIILE